VPACLGFLWIRFVSVTVGSLVFAVGSIVPDFLALVAGDTGLVATFRSQHSLLNEDIDFCLCEKSSRGPRFVARATSLLPQSAIKKQHVLPLCLSETVQHPCSCSRFLASCLAHKPFDSKSLAHEIDPKFFNFDKALTTGSRTSFGSCFEFSNSMNKSRNNCANSQRFSPLKEANLRVSNFSCTFFRRQIESNWTSPTICIQTIGPVRVLLKTKGQMLATKSESRWFISHIQESFRFFLLYLSKVPSLLAVSIQALACKMVKQEWKLNKFFISNVNKSFM
jgi:hypothetical protein